MVKQFKNCDICDSKKWKKIYSGKIRDGKFGSFKNGCVVAHCETCNVYRLDENFCLSNNDYEKSTYREKLDVGVDVNSFFEDHDKQVKFTLETFWPLSLRNKIVMDVGCGGGALLDSLKGITKYQIAVEPYINYHESLYARGYEVFSDLNKISKKFYDKIDYAFAIQVIEHVKNPLSFLQDIFKFLKKDGKLILSTPNRNDILMEAIPEIYQSFFYRTVHRWYFDIKSLKFCAEKAGFNISKIQPVHRYGMSNFINWLNYKSPLGLKQNPYINNLADSFWKGYLESNNKSDCLYFILSKS